MIMRRFSQSGKVIAGVFESNAVGRETFTSINECERPGQQIFQPSSASRRRIEIRKAIYATTELPGAGTAAALKGISVVWNYWFARAAPFPGICQGNISAGALNVSLAQPKQWS